MAVRIRRSLSSPLYKASRCRTAALPERKEGSTGIQRSGLLQEIEALLWWASPEVVSKRRRVLVGRLPAALGLELAVEKQEPGTLRISLHAIRTSVCTQGRKSIALVFSRDFFRTLTC